MKSWVLACLAVVVLASCGSSEDADAVDKSTTTSDATSATTSLETTTTTEPVDDDAWVANTWAMSATFESGDTADILLETGRFGERLTGDDSLAPNCDLDPQRDAAFPWSVTIKNTNDGFDQVLNFAWYAKDVNDLVFSVDRGQRDGCRDATNDYIACQSLEAVVPGESVTCSGYLVWRDARSPASPEIPVTEFGDQQFIMGTFDGSSLGKGTYRLSAEPLMFPVEADGSLLKPYYITLIDIAI